MNPRRTSPLTVIALLCAMVAGCIGPGDGSGVDEPVESPDDVPPAARFHWDNQTSDWWMVLGAGTPNANVNPNVATATHDYFPVPDLTTRLVFTTVYGCTSGPVCALQLHAGPGVPSTHVSPEGRIEVECPAGSEWRLDMMPAMEPTVVIDAQGTFHADAYVADDAAAYEATCEGRPAPRQPRSD